MIYGSDNLQIALGEAPPNLLICAIPEYTERICSGALAIIEDVCTLKIIEDVIEKGGRIVTIEEAQEEVNKINKQSETSGLKITFAPSFQVLSRTPDTSSIDSFPIVNTQAIPQSIGPEKLNYYAKTNIRGRIISSFSSKGGVGKSTTAINLAVGYALKGKRTILADFDIGDGDAPVKLGKSSTMSPNIENWREYELEKIKNRHSSGLYILPHGGNRQLLITESDVQDLITVLSSIYDVVVLDYGVRPFHQHTSRGLELSDQVYVITDLDQDWIPEFASHFRADYGDWITSGKAQLIVNKVASGKYYKPADVAKLMGFTAWYEVSERPNEFIAASRAKKAVIQLPKSETGIQYAHILGEVPAVPKRLWNRIFGG